MRCCGMDTSILTDSSRDSKCSCADEDVEVRNAALRSSQQVHTASVGINILANGIILNRLSAR
jgi:hypothetical protein